MLENYLIDCCSPTLASLKSGSMFNCRLSEDADIEECISQWNLGFETAGLRMCMLRRTSHSALIYVYRTSHLARTLRDPEVQEFLSGYGYDVRNCREGCQGCGECCTGADGAEGRGIETCIEHLRRRVELSSSGECTGFPHEVGVFLDYPLRDVQGFIDNKGRNCKYTGIWKVYDDEAGSRRKFDKFNKCRNIYSELWRSGRRSILQLTVAG